MNDMSIACFLSVARTGSIPGSARQLSITQQSVSRHIQSLEEELGYALFNRGYQSFTLTRMGKKYLSLCVDYDRRIMQTIEKYDPHLGNDKTRLTVFVSEWLGVPDIIRDAARRLFLKEPDTHLNIYRGTISEIQQYLDSGYADMALVPDRYSHQLSGIVMSQKLFELPLYITVRKDHPAAAGAPDLKQLQHYPFCVVSLGEVTEEETLFVAHSYAGSLGIPPEKIEILPNGRSVFAKLLYGDGYTISPMKGYNEALFTSIPLQGKYNAVKAAHAQKNRNGLIYRFETLCMELAQNE